MVAVNVSDSGLSTTVPGFTPPQMLRPSAFPHPVTRLELRETNISWVILTGEYAYKIKKSVQLDFIDTLTLAQRRRLCEEELRLNRRLESDLYVDVVAITLGPGGARVGGDGEIIEYAVRMKQFEATEELFSLLERGAVSQQEIADLGRRLADFHTGVPIAHCTDVYVHTGQLHDAVLGNLATLLAHLDRDTALPEMGFLIDWTHDFLHDSLAELRMREQTGFIRECHGDLHARNIVRWHGRLLPFDCLEFDPRLRWIDVMNDVAFLAMDLMAHDRKDLAFVFLNSYLEVTGDYAGIRLLSFYAVYRALVRAMVDGLGAEQDVGHREALLRRLRTRIKFAAAFIAKPAPTLYVMHGPSGSGKSSLSEFLAGQLGAVRVRSDLERKRLAGMQSSAARDAGFAQGIYTPEFSHRTYARLLECAESCLRGGLSVIIDAAFLNTADRDLFRRLAVQQSVRYIIVSCEADRAILAKRIAERRQTQLDSSDADVTVLERQLQTMEPLSAADQLQVVAVDTTAARAYEEARAAIEGRLIYGTYELAAGATPSRT